MIFHTYIIWTDRSRSLKCKRSTTLGFKDIGIRKSKFVAKTQFLYKMILKKDNEKLSKYCLQNKNKSPDEILNEPPLTGGEGVTHMGPVHPGPHPCLPLHASDLKYDLERVPDN